MRVLVIGGLRAQQRRATNTAASAAACWCRRAIDGMVGEADLKVVTQARSRRRSELDDLLFAWQRVQVREVERHRVRARSA